ncbi:ATP-binding protein [Clostridium sporogenes]|uniref:ATP-binding protein n=1 Tax=Clostridium sporogenes TaxID=1509 RepID=UPI00024BAE98|nr:ATP-binding protein [Clostridium sporogenes]EHN15198.1 sensor histidine kinase [Clostridium sporogenes PA 3679]MDU4599568.1 ATP-binding protein [Clostridium sporogenes]NFQ33310.1 sensor histidine kinase [Clostridium sporogenes]NFQ58504.1 sensor histidine kinase [Clostridium sporogenes]NFU08051.1 sensor histidine kinase [Clostridium sporogenes]
MIFIIIVLMIFLLLLLSYVFFMKREIKNITIQLNEYNNLKSLKKIDDTLFDKEIENLAYSINKHIDINIQSQIKQKRLEEEIRKNIAPKIDLPKENIMAIGNEGAIKRVLQNLIVNIIKHSKEDVYIGLKKENNKAVLTTINRCDDIKEEDIDLIFNRFYKKDDARTNKNGSTGLGLFISKRLMEKMNGEIYAEVHKDLLHIFCKWDLK